MTRYFRVLASILWISGLLCAQEIAGRWTGVADTADEAGTKRQERQTLEIKSEDGKLSGLLVNRSGNGGLALQVQQDGSKVNLYGFLTFEGGEHLRWKFELKDGKLVGSFSALHDSPKKWIYDRIGAMTVTKDGTPRASAAAASKSDVAARQNRVMSEEFAVTAATKFLTDRNPHRRGGVTRKSLDAGFSLLHPAIHGDGMAAVQFRKDQVHSRGRYGCVFLRSR